MPIAVFDSVTGKIFSNSSSGIHITLILLAEQDLGIEHLPLNDRFVCGRIENGIFLTGLRTATDG